MTLIDILLVALRTCIWYPFTEFVGIHPLPKVQGEEVGKGVSSVWKTHGCQC